MMCVQVNRGVSATTPDLLICRGPFINGCSAASSHEDQAGNRRDLVSTESDKRPSDPP